MVALIDGALRVLIDGSQLVSFDPSEFDSLEPTGEIVPTTQVIKSGDDSVELAIGQRISCRPPLGVAWRADEEPDAEDPYGFTWKKGVVTKLHPAKVMNDANSDDEFEVADGYEFKSEDQD